MGKNTGFLEIKRKEQDYQAPADRIEHYSEFTTPLSLQDTSLQGARCMDCGIPFCHSYCPVNNNIPKWNDLVYQDQWKAAFHALDKTNNFPEFTGRICPAPCEAACTLNIDNEPVTIKSIEQNIIEYAWEQGWVEPQVPLHHTGKQVAVVGSGPAGLACAQQLARRGHSVVVYEKTDRIGGLLRYGIPDFKMDKSTIDRRLSQLQAEGVKFMPNTHIGVDIMARQLVKDFDAVVLAGGSEAPRDLPIPGRDLNGIHFAMDFLSEQNKRVAGDDIPEDESISAYNKHVIVIGGGDTGSDCVGTSIRQGALSVTQLEIMPKPPLVENKALTWPNWPYKLVTTSSHEEGVDRDWSITTESFVGDKGVIKALRCTRASWSENAEKKKVMAPVSGTEFELSADLVLLAMGFVHPVYEGMLAELGVSLDERGNVDTSTSPYQSSLKKVFSAGDMRRGQSLVVWAIREGRECAAAVDQFLQV